MVSTLGFDFTIITKETQIAYYAVAILRLTASKEVSLL